MNYKIEENIKNIIFKNINKDKFKVFLFGSRAKWNHKKYSDWDIGILWDKQIEYEKYLKLKRQLNELPYLIDLVDFHLVDENFKKLALKYTKPWN